MSSDFLGRISRRRFLSDSAGFTLALPFLPSVMMPSLAFSQTVMAPKRFISVFTSNGQRSVNWHPNQGKDVPWNIVNAAENIRDYRLSLLPGGLTSTTQGATVVLGPEFNALRDKLLLVRGLDGMVDGTSHLGYTMLSSYLSGPPRFTIDQILANSSKIYPTPPKIRSLHQACVAGQGYYHGTSWDLSGQMLTPFFDPAAAFTATFGGGPTPAPSTNPLHKSNRQKRVIDRVIAEFRALRDHTRISSEDKGRLDEHATHLQDLQSRIAAQPPTPSASCQTPSSPMSARDFSLVQLPGVVRNHLDILIAAIKCDVTRVANFVLAPPTCVKPYSFFAGSGNGDHHSLSHSAAYNVYGDHTVGVEAQLGVINNWYAKQVAYLLNQLNVPEPATSGTYLDNTLVFWGNEDGTWNHDPHPPIDMPVLLAGGGGYFNTGRYVDYRRPNTSHWGRPYNQLLVTILDSFGITPSEYERGGPAGFGPYVDGRGGVYAPYIDSDAKRRMILPALKKS